MPTFEIEVHRITVSDHTFQIEAATESEARKIALEQAGDCGDYREISAEYEVETSTRIPDDHAIRDAVRTESNTPNRVPDEQDECTLPAMLKGKLRDGLIEAGQIIIADQVFLDHPLTLSNNHLIQSSNGTPAYRVDIRNIAVIWTNTRMNGLPCTNDYRVGVYLNAGPEHELELLHEQFHYRDTH